MLHIFGCRWSGKRNMGQAETEHKPGTISACLAGLVTSTGRILTLAGWASAAVFMLKETVRLACWEDKHRRIATARLHVPYPAIQSNPHFSHISSHRSQ